MARNQGRVSAEARRRAAARAGRAEELAAGAEARRREALRAEASRIASESADVLASLGECMVQLEYRITERDRLVARARAAGASWERIARVLGISKQAAQRRYAAASGPVVVAVAPAAAAAAEPASVVVQGADGAPRISGVLSLSKKKS